MNNTVSVVSIQEAVNELKGFMSTMNNEMDSVLNTLTSLSQQGILSSQGVNAIVEQIKARINAVNDQFNTMTQEFTTAMTESSETVSSSQKSIESSLENSAQ